MNYLCNQTGAARKKLKNDSILHQLQSQLSKQSVCVSNCPDIVIRLITTDKRSNYQLVEIDWGQMENQYG